jgi:hypothetical protein
MYILFATGINLAVFVVRTIVDGRISQFGTLLFIFASSILFAVCVPVLFYLPLRGAHHAMAAFRERLLQDTASRYFTLHQEAHRQPDLVPDSENLSEKVELLKLLQELHQHDSAYPVWPFGMRISIAVAINAVIPLIPSLLGLALELIG